MRVVSMLPNGRGGLYRGCISVVSGRIVEILPAPDGAAGIAVDLDFTPHVALPGFVDLQVNGGFGHDITTDPSTMWPIGQRLLSHGVTAFLPTVITSPPEQRHAAYRQIGTRPRGYEGAVPLGLHIEGPVLARDYAGTHPRAELASGAEGLADELLRETDAVSLVTIAPEVESASRSIARLVGAGIVVSLGHTAATAAQTSTALEAGALALTHVFNGMSPIHQREVGAAGAGLLHPEAFISLIADDYHLSEEALRIAWRMAGPGRICLVTDAMAGMSAPAGTYRIGSEAVECGDAARNGDGSLAGSLLTMPEAARRMREVTGATWDELAKITSTNPADLLGDTDRGQLSPGRRADIVIVDTQLRPVATIIEGKIAFRRGEGPRITRPASPKTGPASETPSPVAIGVDIGGTAFKAAIFDGASLGPLRRGSTGRDRPATEVLAEVRRTIEDLRGTAGADIRSVGIACAGIVDGPVGVVVEATNLEWRNVEVAAAVGQDLGLPVVLEHDVYLAALAEWETGSGVGAESMFYVSVATGVAARLFTRVGTNRGFSNLAGEMGFMPIGAEGQPLESVASARAMSEAFRHETGASATAEQIIAASPGDPVAARIWSEAMSALAQGVAAAVCLDDPEIVVLGGGLSNAGNVLLKALEPRLASLLAPLRDSPQLAVAAHGDRSGIVGAALYSERATSPAAGGSRWSAAASCTTP